MRVDIDKILNGEKISTLPPDHFKVYMVLWALAVKHQTYVLSVEVSRPEYVGGRSNLGQRRGRRSVKGIVDDLAEIGLIEILPSGRINVIGVKEVHGRLGWHKCPENLPLMGNVGVMPNITKEGESQRD
jgi:hypothetical protein